MPWMTYRMGFHDEAKATADRMAVMGIRYVDCMGNVQKRMWAKPDGLKTQVDETETVGEAEEVQKPRTAGDTGEIN